MEEPTINEKFAILSSVICGGDGAVEFEEVGKKVTATLVWLQIEEVLPRREPEKVEGVESGVSISRRKAMLCLISNMIHSLDVTVNKKQIEVNADKDKIIGMQKSIEELRKNIAKEEAEIDSMKRLIDKVR